LNGLTLAYLGDAYYELNIRIYLIEKKMTRVDDLHKQAIRYTSGIAQAKIIQLLIKEDHLTEDELSLYKRGRNSSGPGRKNIDAKSYADATGFESLIGGLYMTDKARADHMIDIAIQYIEKGDFDGKNN